MLLPLQTFGNKTSIYSSYCLEIKTLADAEGIHHGLGVGEAVLLLVLLGGAPVRGPDHPRQTSDQWSQLRSPSRGRGPLTVWIHGPFTTLDLLSSATPRLYGNILMSAQLGSDSINMRVSSFACPCASCAELHDCVQDCWGATQLTLL